MLVQLAVDYGTTSAGGLFSIGYQYNESLIPENMSIPIITESTAMTIVLC